MAIIALAKLQQALTTIVEVITSTYTFVFALLILIQVHTSGQISGWESQISTNNTTSSTLSNGGGIPSFLSPTSLPTPMPTVVGDNVLYELASKTWLYYYLFLWVVFEGLNLLVSSWHRIATNCRVLTSSSSSSSSSTNETMMTMLLLKLVSFSHYFFVLFATAGFLGQWLNDPSNVSLHSFNYALRLAFIIGQILMWLIILFGTFGAVCIMGLLQRPSNFLGSHPSCFMLFTGSIATAGYWQSWCGCSAPVSNFLCFPIYVATFFMFPLSFFGFILLIVAQSVSWGVIVATLGIPLFIARLVLGREACDLIVKIRERLYGNTCIKYLPAVLYIVMEYFGRLSRIKGRDANAGGIYYVEHYIDPNTKNPMEIYRHQITVGICFDGVVSSCIMLMLLIPGSAVAAFWIITQCYPNTIESVGNSILSNSKALATYWIIAKLAQLLVSIMLPLFQIIARGLLLRARVLLNEYYCLMVKQFDLAVLFSFLYRATSDATISLIMKQPDNESLSALNLTTVLLALAVRCREESDIVDEAKKRVISELLVIAEILFDFQFTTIDIDKSRLMELGSQN